jgi:hypothetical protein
VVDGDSSAIESPAGELSAISYQLSEVLGDRPWGRPSTPDS